MKPCAPTSETEQHRRYARHFVLPEIGQAGQDKLLASHVAVIGAGGLGSSALAYLAAAGVGHLTIIEPDRVELSNLQRQLLFETADIGRMKADAARDRLEEQNPDITITTHAERLTEANAARLLTGADIILDGSDNFATRFAVQAACFALQKTLISAAISGFSAQLSTFKPHLGAPHPCYRCLVPELPEREVTCAQEGILGPLAGLMGSWQAIEAIKELLSLGGSLSGSLLVYDALQAAPRVVSLPRAPGCPLCGG